MGSSLVGKMAGALDDKMAEAIEAAKFVIVFASKSYKHSANCRYEAKYANQLCRQGLLQIIYVMMDEGYTPNSKPNRMDGWLGFIVGDSIYYSLHDASCVSTVVDEISVIVGDECKLTAGRGVSTTASPSSARRSAGSSTLSSDGSDGSSSGSFVASPRFSSLRPLGADVGGAGLAVSTASRLQALEDAMGTRFAGVEATLASITADYQTALAEKDRIIAELAALLAEKDRALAEKDLVLMELIKTRQSS
jgi:TIR domain